MTGFTTEGMEYVPAVDDTAVPAYALLAVGIVAVALLTGWLAPRITGGGHSGWRVLAAMLVLGALVFTGFQVVERMQPILSTQGTVTETNGLDGRMRLEPTGDLPLHVSGDGWDRVRAGDEVSLTCTGTPETVLACDLQEHVPAR